jgi:hypothetical protein
MPVKRYKNLIIRDNMTAKELSQWWASLPDPATTAGPVMSPRVMMQRPTGGVTYVMSPAATDAPPAVGAEGRCHDPRPKSP